MTTNATLRKSTLLSRAALIALTVGAASSALAAEEEQPSETIVVTSTKFNTDAAPAKASLETTEPQTIINRSYIEDFIPSTADYVSILAIVPGMTGSDPNGTGLSDGGAKNTLRGFSDGNFAQQFDGIPYGDTNGPSHHNISYFPPSTIGSLVVDRGPGNAGNLGAATYGGTVKMFSRTLSDEFGGEAEATYGSFNTALAGAIVQSGSFDAGGKTRILLGGQTVYSDGALSLQNVQTHNAQFKADHEFSPDWKITLYANWSYLNEHLPDNDGLTPAQAAVYGRRFSMQNTNPSLPTYSGYNFTSKQTDFDYVKLDGQITDGLRLDNTLYTYSYWNHTYSPNNNAQTLAQIQAGTSADNGTLTTLHGQKLTNQLLAYSKVNDYRVYGDVTRLAQDYDLGWVSGEVRAGLWAEHTSTYRYNFYFDANLCAAQGVNPFRQGDGPAAQACGVVYSKGISDGWKGYAKKDEYTGWDQYQPFMEVDIKPIEGLTLTPGVKYVNWRLFDNSPVAQGSLCGISKACLPYNGLGQNFKQSFTTTDTLPFFQANYKVTRDWSVYFEYAKGIYIPDIGSFENKTPTTQFPAPEETTNYQIGTVFYADNFTFDADAYYIPIKNNYISVNCFNNTETCYVNNGQAAYKGLEGEATYALGRIGGTDLTGTVLFLNGALMSAKATSGTYSGNWEPLAPRWTAAAGILYKHDGMLFSLIDKMVSSEFNDAQNLNYYKIPRFNELNGTIGYSLKGVEVDLNINNILNARSVTKISEDSSVPETNWATSNDLYWWQAPRSFMATLKARF